MRRSIRAVLLLTFVTICLPGQASADGLFIPWAGVNFGNEEEEGDVT